MIIEYHILTAGGIFHGIFNPEKSSVRILWRQNGGDEVFSIDGIGEEALEYDNEVACEEVFYTLVDAITFGNKRDIEKNGGWFRPIKVAF